MQKLDRGEVIQKIINMPSKTELLKSVSREDKASKGDKVDKADKAGGQHSAQLPKLVFSKQVVALSSSPILNRKPDSRTRYPLFGSKIPGLSIVEKVPKLHRSNAFIGYSRELASTNFDLQDNTDAADSEVIDDDEEENEIIPCSQMSDVLTFSQFEAGIQNLSSQSICTQLFSADKSDGESDDCSNEKLAAGEIISEKAIKVELEVTCDDPTKVFDIMKGVFVKKARSRLPAKNGFGESLGRFLFETKDSISPPLQVVIEGNGDVFYCLPQCFIPGPVGSGKTSLLYSLCGLLRGEGKPVFIYDENMEDCQSTNGDIDITELGNRLPKYEIRFINNIIVMLQYLC